MYGGDHEDAESEERGVGEDEVVWAEAAGEEMRDGGGLERHDRELLRDRGGVQDDAGQTAGGDAAVQHETLEEGVVGVVIGEGLTPGGDGSGRGNTRAVRVRIENRARVRGQDRRGDRTPTARPHAPVEYALPRAVRRRVRFGRGRGGGGPPTLRGGHRVGARARGRVPLAWCPLRCRTWHTRLSRASVRRIAPDWNRARISAFSKFVLQAGVRGCSLSASFRPRSHPRAPADGRRRPRRIARGVMPIPGPLGVSKRKNAGAFAPDPPVRPARPRVFRGRHFRGVCTHPSIRSLVPAPR